jgi:hypothetical protein
MSASHTSTSLAGFVAEAPVKLDGDMRRGGTETLALQDRAEQTDAGENRLRRHARLQGLALMIGSSLLSIGVVYGIWIVLSGLV